MPIELIIKVIGIVQKLFVYYHMGDDELDRIDRIILKNAEFKADPIINYLFSLDANEDSYEYELENCYDISIRLPSSNPVANSTYHAYICVRSRIDNNSDCYRYGISPWLKHNNNYYFFIDKELLELSNPEYSKEALLNMINYANSDNSIITGFVYNNIIQVISVRTIFKISDDSNIFKDLNEDGYINDENKPHFRSFSVLYDFDKAIKGFFEFDKIYDLQAELTKTIERLDIKKDKELWDAITNDLIGKDYK